jgi:hypothetical protein
MNRLTSLSLDYASPTSTRTASALANTAIRVIRTGLRAALIIIGILLILLAITTLTPGRIRYFDDWRVNSHWDQITVFRRISFHVTDGRAQILIRGERSEDLHGNPIRTPQPRSPRPNMRSGMAYRLSPPLPPLPPPPPIFDDFGIRYEYDVFHRDYDWADTSSRVSIHPALLLLAALIAWTPVIWPMRWPSRILPDAFASRAHLPQSEK